MIHQQYQKIVASIYDPFMRSLEKVLIQHRQKLLTQTKGYILEVGAGTGVNFGLYPPNVKVWAIEPSTPMYKKALKMAKQYPNIQVFNIGIEQVEQQKNWPVSFDYITSMLVLCTIKDPLLATKLYTKYLNDKGKLLVLEHIHSSKKLYGRLQKIVNPVWRPLADGCNLTRRQDQILKKSGFIPIYENYFKLGTDWYEAIMKKTNQ